LVESAFVGGEWIAAGDADAIVVSDPATGLRLGSVPNLGARETRHAIAAAEKARPAWQALTAHARAALLKQWHALILANIDDLSRILSAEQGKPFVEAQAEIRYGASFIEWFAEEGKRAYGDVVPSPKPKTRIFVTKTGVGVTAAITPWNFPNAMITRKCAPALAAGCTIVVKPSELTPFSATALARLAQEAGIPDGVLSVVTGDAAAIGGEMTGNGAVRKLSFTGSTRVGKLLAEQSAASLKKLSLELGGNAPLIVFDDADLDVAVTGTMSAKFRNSGQACVAANRIYVQRPVYEAFVDRLVEAVGRLKVGSALELGSEIGPLINESAVRKVEAHIADAVAKGAKVVLGGTRDPRGGTFFAPTVLRDAANTMLVACDETFGPLAAVFPFETEADAIAMANATPFGLAAYIFTKGLDRTWRVTDALETGMVGVNDGLISNEVAPFGGVKESGYGREGSKYGLSEFLTLKYVMIAEHSESIRVPHPEAGSARPRGANG
jgi:succinate-semialdehyde dehydrogenase/glutarate-semialdehyde dehydrogenase